MSNVKKDQSLPGYVEFFQALREKGFSEDQIAYIQEAYKIAKYGHAQQTRDDRSRYFCHPKRVAWILVMEYGVAQVDVIVQALLHDLKEDQYILGYRSITSIFGFSNTIGISALTKAEGESMQHALGRIIATRDFRPILVKSVDRQDNSSTLSLCERAKQVRKAEETRMLFLRGNSFFDQALQYVPPVYHNVIEGARQNIESDLINLGL